MQTDLLEGLIYYTRLEAPTGDLICVAADEAAIVRIATGLGEEQLRAEAAGRWGAKCVRRPAHAPLREATRQLEEYFAGRRLEFQLPLKLCGTPFQLRVWQALERIPYGTTCSYQQLARTIGRPKAARAVGAANRANPVAIVIPCHRVIQADGRLGGYGGGRRLKQFLLELEKRVSAARPPGPSVR